MSKFNFPQIRNIKIRNFSLYKKEDKIINIDENVIPGIFCLAGANGLGKSTFQNIINYALTGLVLAPGKIFLSPDKISEGNSNFTNIYFDGRIKAEDKKIAEVELLFTIKNRYYRVVRGFFEKDTIRELEIYEFAKNKKVSLLIKDNDSSEYLSKKYQEEITNDIGIMKYEYYVFMQLYVFTFDENRRLLFWDYRALSNALSISFSNNLDDAEALINIMGKMEKLESDARNQRWQAKQIYDEIKKITGNYKEPTNKEKRNYLEICEKYDEAQKTFDNLSIEYESLLNNRNCLHSDILTLEIKYKEYFTDYSEPKSKLLNSTFVQMMVKNEECLICGAKGKYILEKINKNIYGDSCPLCDTPITDEDSKTKNILFDKIKKIDNQISEKRIKLNSIINEIEEKELLIKRADIELKKHQQQKNKIERDYPHFLENGSNHDIYVSKLKEQYQVFDKKSEESYKKRDDLKSKFNSLEKKIKKAYNEGEMVFVPIFKELAKSFIGYDLDIKFISKNRKISLVLDLDSSARTESHKLSESQRFFLDIALRMSLAIYLSSPGIESTIFIDTPEGALDIAYETRVGKMFAYFINSYSQNIIMTANINSSQLLISLAKNIKRDKMLIRRMLDWIDLSIVQKEEEKLFKKYFDNVESLLRRKNEK